MKGTYKFNDDGEIIYTPKPESAKECPCGCGKTIAVNDDKPREVSTGQYL